METGWRVLSFYYVVEIQRGEQQRFLLTHRMKKSSIEVPFCGNLKSQQIFSRWGWGKAPSSENHSEIKDMEMAGYNEWQS